MANELFIDPTDADDELRTRAFREPLSITRMEWDSLEEDWPGVYQAAMDGAADTTENSENGEIQ